MPNGDIRFFQIGPSKSGVGELRVNAANNAASTVICGTVGCVVVDYDLD